MREHTKIYSNELLQDAILGRIEYIKELTSDNYYAKIQKLNNDFYELRLYKNDNQILLICNTIDCLYSIVDGYYKGIYDMKREEKKNDKIK